MPTKSKKPKRTIKTKSTKKVKKTKKVKRPNMSPQTANAIIGGKDWKVDQILLKTRCIFINGVIDEKMVGYVNSQLLTLGMISDDPIYVRINSCGGSVVDGFSIIDTMQGIVAPVVTMIVGKAFSMGGIISIAGDCRLMTRNSIWLGHPISAGGGNDYINFLRDRAGLWDKLETMGDELIKKRTKLSPEDMMKMKNGELWLGAQECLDKGIVEKII